MTDAARNRLDELARARGVGLAALSRMIGRNDAYLQQFVKRGSPQRLDERDRRALAGFLGVEEGELGAPPSPDPMVAVPRIDARASAGPGAVADDDRVIGEERVDPRVLRRLGVAAGAVSMIAARGESMAPLIHDGDALFVDTADRRLSSREGLFVIRLDGALLVKHVARIGFEVAVRSENPDAAAIPPVRADRVEVIGRVVRLARSLR